MEIRQDRVDAFLAFVAKHGPTYMNRPDFAQFTDLTEAEGEAAVAKLRAQITVEKAKLGKLNKVKKRR